MRLREFCNLIYNLMDADKGTVTLGAQHCNGVRIVKDDLGLVYHTSGIQIRFNDLEPVIEGVYLTHMGRAKALIESRHIQGLEVL